MLCRICFFFSDPTQVPRFCNISRRSHGFPLSNTNQPTVCIYRGSGIRLSENRYRDHGVRICPICLSNVPLFLFPLRFGATGRNCTVQTTMSVEKDVIGTVLKKALLVRCREVHKATVLLRRNSVSIGCIRYIFASFQTT